MANRQSIQLLRGTEQKIKDLDASQLLDGQPLYDKTNNYLYVGNNKKSKLEPVVGKKLYANEDYGEAKVEVKGSEAGIPIAQVKAHLVELNAREVDYAGYSFNNSIKLISDVNGGNSVDNQGIQLYAATTYPNDALKETDIQLKANEININSTDQAKGDVKTKIKINKGIEVVSESPDSYTSSSVSLESDGSIRLMGGQYGSSGITIADKVIAMSTTDVVNARISISGGFFGSGLVANDDGVRITSRDEALRHSLQVGMDDISLDDIIKVNTENAQYLGTITNPKDLVNKEFVENSTDSLTQSIGRTAQKNTVQKYKERVTANNASIINRSTAVLKSIEGNSSYVVTNAITLPTTNGSYAIGASFTTSGITVSTTNGLIKISGTASADIELNLTTSTVNQFIPNNSGYTYLVPISNQVGYNSKDIYYKVNEDGTEKNITWGSKNYSITSSNPVIVKVMIPSGTIFTDFSFTPQVSTTDPTSYPLVNTTVLGIDSYDKENNLIDSIDFGSGLSIPIYIIYDFEKKQIINKLVILDNPTQDQLNQYSEYVLSLDGTKAYCRDDKNFTVSALTTDYKTEYVVTNGGKEIVRYLNDTLPAAKFTQNYIIFSDTEPNNLNRYDDSNPGNANFIDIPGFYSLKTKYVTNLPSSIGVDAILQVLPWSMKNTLKYDNRYVTQELTECGATKTQRRWIRHRNATGSQIYTGEGWSEWSEVNKKRYQHNIYMDAYITSAGTVLDHYALTLTTTIPDKITNLNQFKQQLENALPYISGVTNYGAIPCTGGGDKSIAFCITRVGSEFYIKSRMISDSTFSELDLTTFIRDNTTTYTYRLYDTVNEI